MLAAYSEQESVWIAIVIVNGLIEVCLKGDRTQENIAYF
jgi:hypothetical protein